MPSVRGYLRAFNGGEVTPEFFGRVDDAKYQTGLRTCRNLIVKPHGPATNRGGLRFVAKVKYPTKKTRVLRFVYSTDQSLVIEMGEGYFRFHTNGATFLTPPAAAWLSTTIYEKGDLASSGGVTYYALKDHSNQAVTDPLYWYPLGAVYEVPSPYLADDLARIKFVQSNDVVTLTHPSYPVAELRRYSASKWVYEVVSFKSALSPPTGVSATATPAATDPGPKTLQSYVVTAVADRDESPSSETEADGSVPIQPGGGIGIKAISKANPGEILVTTLSGDPRIVPGARVYLSNVGGMTEINNKFYQIDTVTVSTLLIIASYRITLEPDGGGVPVDTSAFTSYTGGGMMSFVDTGGVVSPNGVGSCANNLFDDGAYNTIAWQAVAGAKRYRVYKQSNGLFGYIGETTSLSFRDDNIAPDLSITPPIYDDPIGTAGNYPGAVGYFEQRRCFAGSINEPAYFWATRSGTEKSLTYSIPSRDDDSIRFRIAARERSEIRHIVPMGNLILLAESLEWRVTPAAGEVLTPDVSLRPQSAIGANHAPPVIANNNLIFAAARGGHLRELAYSNDASGYVTGDICMRSPHLFDGYEIVDLAYAKAPFPVVWGVSTSGKLLGVTYVPEQQVGAWHQHDTEDGAFEHICVVPEGIDDVLYAVVNRETALGNERFIERMEPRNSNDDALGFFVDSGLSYEEDEPALVFGGLDHLNGKTVQIIADGGVVAPQVVTGGQITLDEEATTVHVGLKVTCDARTLPVAFETAGFGQGRPKNVNAVWLRLFATRDVKIGPSFDKLTEYKPRSAENFGSPPDLLTKEIKVALSPSWANDGDICIRHDQPLPFTLLSMTPEYAIGG